MRRLESGEELADISVRTLASDCDVDRQTFYYHFKNLHTLAEYAYERKVEELLNVINPEVHNGANWKERARVTLSAIEQSGALRDNIRPLVNEGLLWVAIARRIERNLHSELGEQLSKYDLDEDERGVRIKNLSCAIASLYIAWVRGELEGSLEDTLDAVERMRCDFLAGIDSRHAKI